MTVKKLRSLLKGLDGDMQVLMPLVGEEGLVTVCAENSQVIQVYLAEDDEDENGEEVSVLLLVGCSCHVETELEPNISEDQLN